MLQVAVVLAALTQGVWSQTSNRFVVLALHKADDHQLFAGHS